MATEFRKTGIIQTEIIEQPVDFTISNSNLIINSNLAKNTFGTTELGYTVPASGGSEGGPIYAVTDIVPGQTYTVSAGLKGNANMNLYTLNSGGNVSFSGLDKGTLTSNYKFYTITFVAPTNKGTINSIYICTRWTSTPTPGDGFKVGPNTVKIETGSKATPGIPHTVDSIYTTKHGDTLNKTITNPAYSTEIIEN